MTFHVFWRSHCACASAYSDFGALCKCCIIIIIAVLLVSQAVTPLCGGIACTRPPVCPSVHVSLARGHTSSQSDYYIQILHYILYLAWFIVWLCVTLLYCIERIQETHRETHRPTTLLGVQQQNASLSLAVAAMRPKTVTKYRLSQKMNPVWC